MFINIKEEIFTLNLEVTGNRNYGFTLRRSNRMEDKLDKLKNVPVSLT